MNLHPHLTLTVAREHQGWFVLGDSRIGPFSDKALASELADAMAAFFRSLGHGVSVHTSMWTSGPRSHVSSLVRPAPPLSARRAPEPASWADASGAADLRRFFADSADPAPQPRPTGCDDQESPTRAAAPTTS